MKRIFINIVMLSAVSMIWAQAADSNSLENPNETKALSNQPVAEVDQDQAPEGYIMIEESVLIEFSDLAGEHFRKAKMSFLKKNYSDCVREIRRGKAFVKLEWARAKGQDKKDLEQAMQDLETLAQQIEDKSEKSITDIEKAFAKVHYTMAKHHLAKAMEYDAEKDIKKTGYDLRSSMVHVEDGIASITMTIEEVTAKTIEKVRATATKLIEDAGWQDGDSAKAVEESKQEIDKLGQKLEPQKQEDEQEATQESETPTP